MKDRQKRVEILSSVWQKKRNGDANGVARSMENGNRRAVLNRKKKSGNSENTSDEYRPEFTFLTNHSHVLVCLARDPRMRLRDVAAEVGITERAVQAIIRDLTAVDVLRISKDGRRNVYSINQKVQLRHPVEEHRTIGDLLRLVL